jgi:ectoine hydroxylase-related dioxygenase (phytanoyl-CoA dioxygenase family)
MNFVEFHQQLLPQRLADHGNKQAASSTPLQPLALQLAETGTSFTYYPSHTGIDIHEGQAEAKAVIELSQEHWDGLATDLETVPGLLYGNKLGPNSRGDMGLFMRWEPLLRSIYHGYPLFNPNDWQLLDDQQRPLDPAQSFTLDAEPAAMKEFLNCAGYLVVDQVFTEQELLAMRNQALQLRELASEGDQASWWGKNTGGAAICTRVLAASRMPAFADLYQDPRICALQALLPAELEAKYTSADDELDGITVVYKTPDMDEGLSDLPWHRDCGMGGHAFMCPAIVLSIYLYDATEASGELRFLPGSHKASCGFLDSDKAYGVAAPARAGSVSLHFTDVMHAAPQPRGDQAPFRTSVLLSFARVKGTHSGERHYNDVLLGNEDGQIDHMDTLLVERGA